MKYLKRFNESGLSSNLISELSDSIKTSLSHIYPHIEDKDGNIKKFFTLVTANQSKYGKQIEVGFFLEDGNDPYNLRGGILYSDINSDLKQINFLLDIKDIIMNVEGASDVTLIRFNYFGYEVAGNKDGRTKTIEDVSDKFEEVLDELESKPETETKGNRIVFWFNIID